MSTAQMTCPKCHTAQPTSETCLKCGLIIAKYREPSQYQEFEQTMPDDGYANNQVNHRQTQAYSNDTPTLFSPKIIALTVLFFLGGYFFIGLGLYAPRAGKYLEENTTYVNPRFGFKVEIPEYWNQFEPKQVLPPLILRKFGDDYFFLAGPSSPSGPMMIINKMSIDAENFSLAGWKMFIADVKQREKVHFDEIYEVGGYKVHSYGYQVKEGSYRENHMFLPKNGNSPIEIFFYVKAHQDGSDFRDEIEEIVLSLKKTAFLEFI